VSKEFAIAKLKQKP